MQLFGRMPRGGTLTVEVEGTDTIEELRRKFYEQNSDVHPSLQRLVFEGRELAGSATIADSGLSKECMVQITLRPKRKPVQLDVGGTPLSTTLSTLVSVEPSRLYAMFIDMTQGSPPVAVRGGASSGGSSAGGIPEGIPYLVLCPLPQTDTGAYQIDRDGRLFRFILTFLRGKLEQLGGAEPVRMQLPTVPDDLLQLSDEADYFGLDELAAACRQQAKQLGRRSGLTADPDLLTELQKRGLTADDRTKLITDGLSTLDELERLQPPDFAMMEIDLAAATARARQRQQVPEQATRNLVGMLGQHGGALEEDTKSLIVAEVGSIEHLANLQATDLQRMELGVMERRELRNLIARAKLLQGVAEYGANDAQRAQLRDVVQRHGGKLSPTARDLVLNCCGRVEQLVQLSQSAKAQLETVYLTAQDQQDLAETVALHHAAEAAARKAAKAAQAEAARARATAAKAARDQAAREHAAREQARAQAAAEAARVQAEAAAAAQAAREQSARERAAAEVARMQVEADAAAQAEAEAAAQMQQLLQEAAAQTRQLQRGSSKQARTYMVRTEPCLMCSSDSDSCSRDADTDTIVVRS